MRPRTGLTPLQAAQTAAAESVRSRIEVVRAALAEAVERRDALERAIAGSGDMRPGVTWGFRRPKAAAKAAALAAARDSVAAAAAEVAPSGGSDLDAALNNAAGAVLTDVSRALTAAHADAADVERMTEAATARDAVAQFDTSYRSRLEVQLFDLPIAHEAV